jgi:hypothetical protein
MTQEITEAQFTAELGVNQDEDWWNLSYQFDPITLEGVGLVTWVASEGGGEGAGEHMEFTVKLRPEADWLPERYFTMEGYYSSYDGSEWDSEGFYESVPKEVTEVRYVRKR